MIANKTITKTPDTLIWMLFLSSLCSLPLALVYLNPNDVRIAPDMFRQDQDIILAHRLGAFALFIGFTWTASTVLTAFGALGLKLRWPGACQLARSGQALAVILSLGLWLLGKPLGAVILSLVIASMLFIHASCADTEEATQS